MFPLSRAFETLPGNMSLTDPCIACTGGFRSAAERHPRNAGAGQTNCQSRPTLMASSSAMSSPAARGSGRSDPFQPVGSRRVGASEVDGQHRCDLPVLGDLTTSLSARYIGGAKQDNTWCDAAGSCGR